MRKLLKYAIYHGKKGGFKTIYSYNNKEAVEAFKKKYPNLVLMMGKCVIDNGKNVFNDGFYN